MESTLIRYEHTLILILHIIGSSTLETWRLEYIIVKFHNLPFVLSGCYTGAKS